MDIPKRKIKGLRFGQLIYNALQKKQILDDEVNITNTLFYIENRELQKIIDKYLKDYG